MNRALLSLLGQQAATQASAGLEYDENGNLTDIINEKPAPNYNEKPAPNYDDYALNNTEALMGRNQDIKETEEASGRRGMFGMKGTLRDVIGILGDAFLIQSGKGPMYAPVRRREQISDAMAGFSVLPKAAAERVAHYDHEMGRQLLEQASQEELKKATLESTIASRESLEAKRRSDMLGAGRLATQSLLRTPGAFDAEGNITPEASRVIELFARQYDAAPEDLLGGLTGKAAELYGAAAINPYQQETLADRERLMDQRDFSNLTGRISATRPRAAPRPSQPTEAGILVGIQRKIDAGQPLNKGEQEFWDSRVTRRNAPPEKKGRRVPNSTGKPSVSNW